MTSLTLLAPAANTPALVPVYLGTIGGIPASVVNARELHTYLENQRQFADWISDRIEKYGFVEDQDFALISQNCEIKKGRGMRWLAHVEPDGNAMRKLGWRKRQVNGGQRVYFR